MSRKRIPDGGLVFKQRGQLGGQLGVGIGFLNTEEFRRCIGPKAIAIPNLALHVFRLAKQRARAIACDHQRCTRLGKAGEVVKITVVPIGEIAVAIAGALRRCGDDGNRVFSQLRCHAGAALGVEGVVGNGVHDEIVLLFR